MSLRECGALMPSEKCLIGPQRSSDSPCALRYAGNQRNFKEVVVKQIFCNCLGCRLSAPGASSPIPWLPLARAWPHPTIHHPASWVKSLIVKPLPGKKGAPFTNKWGGRTVSLSLSEGRTRTSAFCPIPFTLQYATTKKSRKGLQTPF